MFLLWWIVTEDPTNTVTSACSLRFFSSVFFVSFVCIPYGSPPLPGIPPPARAGGEIAGGSHQTVPGTRQSLSLPGRPTLCVWWRKLKLCIQSPRLQSALQCQLPFHEFSPGIPETHMTALPPAPVSSSAVVWQPLCSPSAHPSAPPEWLNHNFMKLREYFLCTKKTK